MKRFFWNEEVFSIAWCRRRLNVALEAVGGRYSPELHIDLPVSFTLEGLASSDSYWHRFGSLREEVLSAEYEIEKLDYTGIGVTKEVQSLIRIFKEWRRKIPKRLEPQDRPDRDLLLDLTRACWDATQSVYPFDPEEERQQAKEVGRQTHLNWRRSGLQYRLRKLRSVLEGFENLLLSSATEAATCGALLLKGEAGQGKTHLFCDAARRAVETDQPAIVLLGGRLSGRHVWSEIGEQLGLGQVGSEELIGAMQAAAEASNAPFLLLIDALNEAEEPEAWREELPALIAEVIQNPWIAVGISIRSNFLPIMFPDDDLSNIVEVEHPGFAERETEATERFFHEFGLEQPRIPQLLPEFTNPLFLKLYCEGLKGEGLTAPPAGEDHVSEVFKRHLKWKARRIASRLGLDPDRRLVEAAVDVFCQALVEENEDSLVYGYGAEIIDGVAPWLKPWPDTLFGQLLGEGVLSSDLAWRRDEKEPSRVVRFTYQRFGDYRVASALLEPFGHDSDRLRQALAPDEPLRQRVQAAPAGWIEALSVLAPERFGIELLEAAQWELDGYARGLWDRAFVRSIAVRRPSAVTQQSRKLLSKVQCRSELGDLVLETMLTVAPLPEHPLNADSLHDVLKRQPMSERDVRWSIPTYYALDYGAELLGGTLDRLIRWAARGPYPGCSEEVIELASIPLIWTFTSPNRRMRDYATKALAQLLSACLQALPPLIRRFDGVDDPYVIERLAVVAHGAVLRGGNDHPEEAIATANELKRVILVETQTPNIITRDAVRGVCEWCLQHGLIDRRAYEEASPTYGSALPGKPRTEEELRRIYDGENLPDENMKYPYRRLLFSIFIRGDFGRYVIERKLRNFSCRLLSSDRTQSIRMAVHDQETVYPIGEGMCWVFERVLSLVWTPGAFLEFDQLLAELGVSRSEHKSERFGKKYQWIAFRELIARIADNFHMMNDFNGRLTTYKGPWQFFGRDIDPTLPPPCRERNEYDQFDLKPTFSSEDEAWWNPPRPISSYNESPGNVDWVTQEDDLPKFELLVQRTDNRQIRWVVLRACYDWESRLPEVQEGQPRFRRHMRSHIYSWLVHPADRAELIACFNRCSLKEGWIPEDVEGIEVTDAAYLGELPWAMAMGERLDSWSPVSWFDNSEESVDVSVCPTWSEYLWEGGVLDCSIDEGVRACFPAPVLFEAGKLVWTPGTREWRYAPDGTTVAQFLDGNGHEEDSHSALLVREDWLKRTLRITGHSVVFGWFGEEWLMTDSSMIAEQPAWTEFDAVASLAAGRWTFGKPRRKIGRPAHG